MMLAPVHLDIVHWETEHAHFWRIRSTRCHSPRLVHNYMVWTFGARPLHSQSKRPQVFTRPK